GLAELDLHTRIGVVFLSELELEAAAMTAGQKRERERWRVDVPADVADVVARPFIHDRARLFERIPSALEEDRGEALLAVAHRLAIALEHIAERQPTLALHFNEQEVRDERGFLWTNTATRLDVGVAGDGNTTQTLLVSLFRHDRAEIFLEAFD